MNDKPPGLARNVLHKFLTIHRHLRRYRSQMTDQGIHPMKFSVLLFLMESGPATVGQIQEFLYRSPSTTSTLIANLEEAGYVTRTRSPDDNRVVIVDLTPTGQTIIQNTPLGGIPLLRRRLGNLSPDRLHRLDQALTDLLDLMEIEDKV